MAFKRSKTDVNSLPHLAEFRRDLRKNLTPAEAAFWNLIKNSKLNGRKFRRQHSVGNYILDFYCSSEKLAIELDGAGHYSPAGDAYDRERNTYLASEGIVVLRFENRLVFEETEWVLDVIRANFRFGTKAEPTGYASPDERTKPSTAAGEEGLVASE